MKRDTQDMVLHPQSVFSLKQFSYIKITFCILNQRHSLGFYSKRAGVRGKCTEGHRINEEF